MKKIQKKRKGFTLIELVVVIVIIAILAAVALLSFGSFTGTAKDTKIRAEHTQLITAGNMARAAKTDPDEVPSWGDIMDYMETSKLLAGQEVEKGESTVHVYNYNKAANTGKLESTLSTGETLVYDFSVAGGGAVTPEPVTTIP